MKLLLFYGSYRRDRMGVRLVQFLERGFKALGWDVEFIDAKAVDLPMLDRMFKEYGPGEAPQAMAELAGKIRAADAFVFVVGEYNWGLQPGLKNLTDHFLEEWFWRPAAIASYSAGRLAGARSGFSWRGTLGEMGMIVTSATMTVGPISEALDAAGEPSPAMRPFLEKSFRQFSSDLTWWAEAAVRQRSEKAPPY